MNATTCVPPVLFVAGIIVVPVVVIGDTSGASGSSDGAGCCIWEFAPYLCIQTAGEIADVFP